MGKLQLKNFDFETALAASMALPTVRIDRDTFLRKELGKYFTPEQVECAVSTTPMNAGATPQLMKKIAKDCINFETMKVSAISFAAGIPGGFALIGTVPADLAQYFGHILRVIQKVVYIYGWETLIDNENGIDDGTKTVLTLLFGAMFGIESATQAMNKVIVPRVAEQVEKKIIAKELTQQTLSKLYKAIGMKVSEEMVKTISAKAVPVIGGAVNGGLTMLTFKPASEHFRRYIEKLAEGGYRQ